MTNRSPIHVLCATNAAYAMPLAVMLTSLVFHFRSQRDLHLHIFQSAIPDTLREKVVLWKFKRHLAARLAKARQN